MRVHNSWELCFVFPPHLQETWEHVGFRDPEDRLVRAFHLTILGLTGADNLDAQT